MAVLSVAERGAGLSGDEAERVFEPFYRSDPGRGREAGGTGLGLSIVAAIAAAHGGSVNVAERPDGGSLFRVRLPLSAEDAAEPHQCPPAAGADGPS
jgi:two-component system OmpR family sensor kinase